MYFLRGDRGTNLKVACMKVNLVWYKVYLTFGKIR